MAHSFHCSTGLFVPFFEKDPNHTMATLTTLTTPERFGEVNLRIPQKCLLSVFMEEVRTPG